MKPKSHYKDESKWVVVLWKMIKKELLHNFPNEYCHGNIVLECKICKQDMIRDKSYKCYYCHKIVCKKCITTQKIKDDEEFVCRDCV